MYFLSELSRILVSRPPLSPKVTPEEKEKHNALKRKALYDIMTCMRDIRKRSERTDNMFEPLRSTVATLSTFGIHLGETVLEQLENAEHMWKLLKKKMFSRSVRGGVLRKKGSY